MRYRPLILFLVLAALIAFGCGGGGGGSTSTGSSGGSGGCSSGSGNLVFRTKWGTSGAITGNSILLSIYDSNENIVKTLILNRGTGTDANLGAFTSATYHVHADLYPLADGGGSKVAELDVLTAVCNLTVVDTEMGTPEAGVRVDPANASFSVQESRHFYAVDLSAAGKPLFEPAGIFAWSASGGVATVNSNGVALGLSPGTGAIQAVDSRSGLTGSAQITVTQAQTRRGKWTVLVYLNAANDLDPFSVLNVNQMETVASNPEVRFVLQWKQAVTAGSQSPTFVGTRRYLVQQDTSPAIASKLVQDLGQGIDMGDPRTLADFVAWGKTYYPADRFVLVIWNHGNGWRRGLEGITRAVSYDDDTGNAIQIWQLEQALTTNHFDIVAWDASLMQMMEVAYEIKANTEFVAGSEESPPGEGYPYDLIFAKFRDVPDETTRNLSKSFIDGMLAVDAYRDRKITQSSIDTSQLDPLAAAIDALAQQLITAGSSITLQVQNARNNAQSYSPTQSRYYRDLVDLCLKLEASSGMPVGVISACVNVRAAVANAVAWEGHNAMSPGSHGIAIDFSPASRFMSGAPDYQQLKFAQATRWDEWLSVAP